MNMSKIVGIIMWQIICVVNAEVSRNILEDKAVVYIGSFKSPQNAQQLGQRLDENNYYVSINPTVWSSAEADCTNIFGPYGGLVAVETVEEWEFLKVVLESYGFGTTYWSSGKYDLLSNEWIWSTNNQPIMQSPPWSAGHPSTPNLVLRIQIYHTSRYDGWWRTVADTQLHRYICEVTQTFK